MSSRISTPRPRKNLKRKSEEGRLPGEIQDEVNWFSPKIRKCRKLPHFEEKEDDSRSEGNKGSDKQNRANDTNLVRNESQGRTRLLGQQQGRFTSTPKLPNSLKDNQRHSQVRRVGKIADRPHCCPMCNKQFKYYSNLKSHWEIIHKKKADDLCEGLLPPSSAGAESPDSSFRCEVCLRDFKYASNLRTHRMVHTGQEEQQ